MKNDYFWHYETPIIKIGPNAVLYTASNFTRFFWDLGHISDIISRPKVPIF